jgi:CheY-like chemotaxis protein
MTRILLADDSRVTRELMKVYLIARDVELLEAADGVEALALARAHRPDLVLADLRMPRLDGLGLCRAMRDDAALQGVPVVILTSARDTVVARELVSAGAREVLEKPIQPRPLQESLRRHLPTPIRDP